MRRWRITSGISLIEAVVALAVMAFGMLAYVGLQSSLRFNSDVAKQRSEAVRIAQQAIEDWRAYSVVETTPSRKAYGDLTAGTLVPQVIEGENARFTRQLTVADAGVSAEALLRGAAPRIKALTVDVSWQDRNGETQTVRLSTTIASSPPELAGTLAVPGAGGPLRLPQGRHAAIPLRASDLGDGRSVYKPRGAGAAMVFVFNNATGMIVGVCNDVSKDQRDLTSADVEDAENCSDKKGMPLSGFVRFATDTEPNAADAENPTSTARNLEVALTLTSTGHADPSHVCIADAPTSALTARISVPYFCAIFFQTEAVPVWSGTSTLNPLAFAFGEFPAQPPWRLADNAADARDDRFRVCRYTPATSDTPTPPTPNQQHPRNYASVRIDEPLTNQNFLVIRAGSGTEAFACPTDRPANPAAGDFVNSNTLPHQPAPMAP